MPYEIIRQDITKMHTDAIVCAANAELSGGGGVDGSIRRAAGAGLEAECRAIGGCAVGDAVITGGYNLPARYVIHAVGPIWRGGMWGEREKLAACWQKSLELARQNDCRSIAFPLISAGTYGFPRDLALKIAIDQVSDFLMRCDMQVYIVIFDRESMNIGRRLHRDIRQFIDDVYADAHANLRNSRRISQYEYDACYSAPMQSESLEEMLKELDESFSQSVLRMIDERGMTDAQCYKRANVDRKLFSKIRGDAHYRPGKRTAVALAIALELNMDQTQALLQKAGFALSRSNKFDVIIEYFIRSGNYDINEINQALFEFDQQLLGV